MGRGGFFFGLGIVLFLGAFNNCSGGFNAGDSVTILNSTTSQCRLETINKAQVLPLPDPSICEQEASYHCDLRRFRPQSGPVEVREIQCGLLSDQSRFCVSTVIYNFDTRRQIAHEAAEEFLEGGSYNRDEASCYNSAVKVKGIPVIRGEGSTLLEALESSIEACRQRRSL